MKNATKTTEKSRQNQNLEQLTHEKYRAWDDDICQMDELKTMAEKEMDWHIVLTYIDFYYIYRIDGEVIGFIKEMPITGDVGMIHFLYVHPDFRHKGYGTDMVEQFSQKFDRLWADIIDEDVEDFYRQVKPTVRKVKAHKSWQSHPYLDYSDAPFTPHGPFIEKSIIFL